MKPFPISRFDQMAYIFIAYCPSLVYLINYKP